MHHVSTLYNKSVTVSIFVGVKQSIMTLIKMIIELTRKKRLGECILTMANPDSNVKLVVK